MSARENAAIRLGAAAPPASVHDLLRFERLLSELSAGFINLPVERIDSAIDEGLRRIVETLGIDRSTMSRESPSNGRMETTYSYAANGIEPVPKSIPARDMFPWALSMVRAGKPVVFARLDDLPPEASVDRSTYERLGLKSHVTMPMVVGGEVHGALHFGCVRHERTWPVELLARMRLLAEMFANALARKQAHDERVLASGFERLASSILASLVLSRTNDEVDAIERRLGDIGRFLRVDRVSLWERPPGQNRFCETSRWTAATGSVAMDWLSGVDIPWISAQLAGGSVVCFSRLADLPAAARGDLPGLHLLGMRSLFAVPYAVAGKTGGALVLATLHAEREWHESMVSRMKLLAEVFASLRARQGSDRLKLAAETEAQQWRERFAHLARVDAVSAMSAAIAHELNQPLMAIQNYAIAGQRRLANSRSADQSKLDELLQKIAVQAAFAGEVLDRVRAMVKRRETQETKIDLTHLIHNALQLIETEARLKEIGVETYVAPDLPPALGDEIQVEQVILNLAHNAIEAMAAVPVEQAVLRLEALASENDGILICVADRGPGIADVDGEKVFEAFHTTKESGLGIGLSLSRAIVEAHGGRLWHVPNPRGGTIFQFTLPNARHCA